jgi:hypothetical protein
MFRRPLALRGLILATAVAVSVVILAGPVSASSGSCTPPPQADTWYCAALAQSNQIGGLGVSDRMVDDYFRNSTPVSLQTSQGFVDDSWRSPFVVQGVESAGGFDWGDFGIGVAAALGAMLLAMGIARRFTGHRHVGVGSA